jgi:arylsulfatase A-like enzyme
VIEQLFQWLDQKGYLKGALVMILADHGDGLAEHNGQRGHAFNGRLYQEFIRVPLLIYDEPNAPYANLEWATQVDIAPTIVSRLGLPVPPVWEGRSLLEPAPRPYSCHFMDMYDVPLYAVIHRTDGHIYKYLRQFGREELFDLAADPGEQHDRLSTTDPAVVGALRKRLSALLTSLE